MFDAFKGDLEEKKASSLFDLVDRVIKNISTVTQAMNFFFSFFQRSLSCESGVYMKNNSLINVCKQKSLKSVNLSKVGYSFVLGCNNYHSKSLTSRASFNNTDLNLKLHT